VGGSIAGESQTQADSSKGHNGMAPAAKVAFMDIGESGKAYLTVPEDLNAGLFPFFYNNNIRIHSNSWGSSYYMYGVDDQMIDQFVYDHQDFVVLVAAGNEYV
jgi:serine protease AprX